MKLFTRIIMLGLLALPALPAQAADKDGRFSVRGVGSTKCSDLSAAVAKKDATALQLYASWLSGYVSASNRLISQTFDAMPGTAATDIVGVVAVLCARSQETLVETATYQALEALNPLRIKQDSPLITMEESGKSLTIRQEALVYVQSELASAGLYKGAIDGKPGAALSRAIRTFQKAQGLPETGLADMDVMIRLRFNNKN